MANPGEQVTDVALTKDRLIVDLADGRSISVPLAWFPRLLHATSQERKNWEIAGAGYGIHWPDVDEDLSVEGLLRGAPAPQAKALSVNTAMHLSRHRKPIFFAENVLRPGDGQRWLCGQTNPWPASGHEHQDHQASPLQVPLLDQVHVGAD